MTALALLDTLDSLGVRVSLGEGDALKMTPASVIPPELLDALRAHKPAVVRALRAQQAGVGSLTPLPEPLARLVRAASSGHLARPALLTDGRVSDLGGYVLAWAATYATGGDTAHAMRRLWAAHDVWGQG